MKFTISLENKDGSSAPVTLSQIERQGPLNAASLGLTLAESKSLLSSVQGELVQSQFQEFVQTQRTCTRCGTRRTLKDYHYAHFKDLFAELACGFCVSMDVAVRDKTIELILPGLRDW